MHNSYAYGENPTVKGRLFCINKCQKICKFIQKVNPRISEAKAKTMEESIEFYSLYRELDSKMVAALIATETDFRNISLKNTNNTKDHGYCQINTVWIKEFKRLKRRPLDIKQLYNFNYCVDRMTEILVIYKKDYLRYHSRNKKVQKKYKKRLDKKLKLFK